VVRREQGWRPAGRKIGFTNRTLWAPYGVTEPMWARVWDRTLVRAEGPGTKVDLGAFLEPRVEPEVVFGIGEELGPTDDPMDVLRCADWIAAGFELVWSPYPGWRFALPDCTAAFGLHGALVVGPPLAVTDDNRASLADALMGAEVTLSREGKVVDRGVGSNVLGGPAHALAHLTRVLDGQPRFDALGPGEVVTTGTITDAAPVAPGQTWTSDYGSLPIDGLTVTFT
jgi:2-oxo-3-hexenedioate decarboxylase